MKNISKNNNVEAIINFLSSLLAIFAGLFVGYIILLFTNYNEATKGFLTILQGPFSNGLSGIGQLFYIATPIIMTGLSVGFAFKTGLFNIGASGQFTIGAFVAIYIGVKWSWLPESIHWIVAITGAAIAGALWGFIPGWLKAIYNVNEVISSIMTNYIGMYLVNMLIVNDVNIYDQIKNQTVSVNAAANIPKLGMNKIFGESYGNIGIIISIIFVVLIYIIIEKSVLGYELKACGQNPNASKYAGINSKKNVIISMMIAGALSGIGGSLMYLYGTGKHLHIVETIAVEGFNGISVALLGLSNPIAILFAALFIAHITIGGYNVQLYNFAPEVIDIIISIIIYCGAFSILFKNLIINLKFKFMGRKS